MQLTLSKAAIYVASGWRLFHIRSSQVIRHQLQVYLGPACAPRRSPPHLTRQHVGRPLRLHHGIAKLPLARPTRFGSLMDRALAGHAAPFAAYWTGPHRFADEFWVLSHHEVAVHDLLPMYDTNGRPITYFWGNTKVPYPGKWAPEPAKFPRAWLTAGAFLDGGGYLKGLRCSQPSLRLLQYEAACGRATLQRPAARGLHCACWASPWRPSARTSQGRCGTSCWTLTTGRGKAADCRPGRPVGVRATRNGDRAGDGGKSSRRPAGVAGDCALRVGFARPCPA